MANLTEEQVVRCNDLKAAYGLEGLHFYHVANSRTYGCSFKDFGDDIEPEDLDFFLKSLSMQQGVVWFDDVGEYCTGIDELKSHYLIFKLAGI